MIFHLKYQFRFVSLVTGKCFVSRNTKHSKLAFVFYSQFRKTWNFAKLGAFFAKYETRFVWNSREFFTKETRVSTLMSWNLKGWTHKILIVKIFSLAKFFPGHYFSIKNKCLRRICYFFSRFLSSAGNAIFLSTQAKQGLWVCFFDLCDRISLQKQKNSQNHFACSYGV